MVSLVSGSRKVCGSGGRRAEADRMQVHMTWVDLSTCGCRATHSGVSSGLLCEFLKCTRGVASDMSVYV